MDTLELYTDASGDHRWRLVASNGRTIAESGEGYRRRRAALKGAGHTLGIAPEPGSDAPILPGYEYLRANGSRVRVTEV